MTFLLVGILLTHRSVIYQVNFFYLRRYNKRPYLAQCLKWDTRSGFIFLVFFLDQVTATIRSMTHKCFCCCCRSNGRRPTYGNIDMYTDLLFSPAFSPFPFLLMERLGCFKFSYFCGFNFKKGRVHYPRCICI